MLRQGSQFAVVSREGGLVLNNALLAVACGTVFLGTFYPLAIDLVGGDKISVGPPFYNRTFVPVMAPVLLAMVIGPMLRWKRDSLIEALRRLQTPAALAVFVAFAALLLTLGMSVFIALGFGVAVWLILGTLWQLLVRIKLFRVPFDSSLRLAVSTPPAFYGLIAAHTGMGILVAGITGMTAFQTENILLMRPGETASLSGYTFRLQDVRDGKGPNYDVERATFIVARGDRPGFIMEPERRFYPVRRQQTTQAAITTNLVRNLYVTIGEKNDAGQWAVRMYYHPLVPWIWGGALLMAFGGALSLSDRRLRIGMPQRSPARVALQAAE
jgi:cytochrome c-type biogenesis protein CcmF